MSNILEIKNLWVEVERQTLLQDLNLTIPVGEVHALLGPNGCGKTTLLMTIMGYSQYEVRKGQILFDGVDITELDITKRARLGLSLAQQRPPTMKGVKLQHLIDYVLENNSQWTQEINELVRIFHVERFLERDINAALSGGEIKRSELFQLLITRPKFAMLDEPDSGIDLETLPVVGQMVNALFSTDADCPAKRNSGLIITHTSYILDYVYADRAHIMLDGRIECAGNPRLVIDEIRRSGYGGCVRCLRQAEEANL